MDKPTAKNVSQAKPQVGGAFFVGDDTATLPTDAASELGTGWTSLGYISEDGFTNNDSIESSTTKAWGGDVVISVQTGKTDTFAFKMMEALNPNVLKMFYGDENVTGTSVTDGLAIKSNSKLLKPRPLVIDELLTDDTLQRTVIPCGVVSTKDAIEHKDNSPLLYGVTVTALPDEDQNTHYTYIKKKGASA